MNISENNGEKITLSFHNYWEQKHVGQVLRPYLDLRDKFKLAVNAVIPPSPYTPHNRRLDTQLNVDKLPDFLDSIDDRGAKLLSEEVAGDRSVVDEEMLMDEASVVIRAFMGQETRQHLDR